MYIYINISFSYFLLIDSLIILKFFFHKSVGKSIVSNLLDNKTRDVQTDNKITHE